MNILPKKSWHVRSKKNIERVRRDEAEAAEKEKEKQRRIAIAESEARTEALRAHARKRRHSNDGEDKIQLMSQQTKHINFFEDEEQGKQTTGTNTEYEAERKMDKEKEEKAIGLLTYLGQSAVESQTEQPWYYKPPEKCAKTQEKLSSLKFKEEFDLKHKWNQDPMKQMTKYLHQKGKVEQRDKGSNKQLTTPPAKPSDAPPRYTETEDDSLQHEHHRQRKNKKKGKHKSKDKKHSKHKKQKKHKSQKSDIVRAEKNPALSSNKTIQQLRAERIRREREERIRTEQLLAQVQGDNPQRSASPPDDRERRYNSQFNPDLIRQKKNKRHYDYVR